MKKNVLLLNPPGDKLYLRDGYCSSTAKANYYFVPIDLLVLSGILYEKHDVYLMDAIVDKVSEESCLNFILKNDFDAVVFLSSSMSWDADCQLLTKVKKADPKTKLIGSGGFMLYEDKQLLEENNWLDAILLDYTTNDIIQYLDEEEPGELNSVSYRIDSRLYLGNNTCGAKVYTIPIPRHELFHLTKYRLPYFQRHFHTSVLTDFGCPFACKFCYNGRGGRINYKVRDVKNIIDELKYIKQLGIKGVFFRDYTFGSDVGHTLELCEGMIKERLNLEWKCQSRVDVLNNELLIKRMKQAGCSLIGFGIEHGTPQMLKKYNKGIMLDQVRKTLELCRKNKIRSFGYFMLGFYEDDQESIDTTLRLSRDLDLDYVSYNVVMPFIGTQMRRELLDNNVINDSLRKMDNVSMPPVMDTCSISRDKLQEIKIRAYRDFYFRPSYILKRIIAIRSLYETSMLLKEGFYLFIKVFKR